MNALFAAKNLNRLTMLLSARYAELLITEAAGTKTEAVLTKKSTAKALFGKRLLLLLTTTLL